MAVIISSNYIKSNGGGYCEVQRDFYSAMINYGTGAEWSSGYLHLKTNIGGMWRVSVEGYDYGSSRCIDSHAGGYVYNGNIINHNIFDNNTVHNGQAGINRVYLNSDNTTITVVLYSDSWYVTQFSMSVWDGNLQGGPAQVLETSMRGDNGNFY